MGPASVALPPSPNVHSYRTIRPSESFDADASKTRGVPTFPKARAVVKFAVGGLSTYRAAVGWFFPLKLSVTVHVTLYGPPCVETWYASPEYAGVLGPLPKAHVQ